MNACLTRIEKEKNMNYSHFLTELEKIKTSYSSSFDRLMKENKEKVAKLEDRDHLIKKLTHDNTLLKRKEAKYEKTIHTLGNGINELKEMLDSVLVENIKLKMSKEEESNLRKGERDILKKQYENLIKNRNKEKIDISNKIEKLLQTTQTSIAFTPGKEFQGKSMKAFTFDNESDSGREVPSIGTLKDIMLKDIQEETNDFQKHDEFDGMNDLFVKEIGVDTKDLMPINNQETTTKDLMKYFSKDQAAQTVYFDEINDDNEGNEKNHGNSFENSERSLEVSPLLKSINKSSNGNIMENMVESTKKKSTDSPFEKPFLIRKRMFSFSAESLQHLDKFKEIQTYTLTGISEWYSGEMENFFQFLRNLTENYGKENFYELLDQFDWVNLTTMFGNICMIHEQFIKNIRNRDNTRSKEILQHKIELLERKIEMDEAEKMRNLFRKNYNKLREKFEEFYKMTIKIQSMNEDEEIQTYQNLTPNLQVLEKLNIERKASMNVIFDEGNMEKIEKVGTEKKIKTVKPKNHPDIHVNISSSIKIDEEEKYENSSVSMTKSQFLTKKFEDFPVKISDKKKMTYFSIKKAPPVEIKDKEQDRTENSNLSIETKGLPNLNNQSITPFSSNMAKSYHDIVRLEEEMASSKHKNSAKLSAAIRKHHREKSEVDLMHSSFLPTKKNKDFGIFERQLDIKTTLEIIDKEKNEVNRLEEKQLKDQKEFKDMMANEKMIDLINQANNVLPQKKSWDKINSLNADKCYAFLHRIEVSEILPSKKVTLATVLKLISQLLTELIKLKFKKQGNLNPLFFILYEYLMQRYGNNRERAEGKMIKIMQGCKTHFELPRVRNFARLLSILPDKTDPLSSTYDGNDLEFYLNYFMQLDDNPMSNIPGVMLAMSPQDHAFIALAKALEVFNRFCGNYSSIISKAKQENIVNQIKAVKLDDPIVSRKYVVDVDFVLEKFFEMRDEIFKIYKTPFLAVDVDYNEALNINEFMLLIRNIERNKFTEKQIIDLFGIEYDFYDEENEEKCMSFKRFAFVCERENIINLKKQEIFAQQVTDEVNNVKQLKDDWDVKKNLIKLKLIKTNYYNSFYVKVIKCIEVYLNSKNTNEEEGKINWFRYRIMDEESNTFLLQFETDSCLPKEFNLVSMKIGELF